jgi:hypothetical protein
MKKKTVSRKLSLHRETITRLERAATHGGATVDVVGDVTSCTQDCGCSPTGCSAEVNCVAQ